MLRYGWARRLSRLDRNDVAPVLAVFDPVRFLENPHGPLPRNGRQRCPLGGNLDFADFNRRRHPVSGTCRKAASDGFADIFESLGFGPSLGDAAGNRRALGYEHAGFVGLQRDEKFHTWILSGLWP